MDFQLHPALLQDTFFIKNLKLSQLLLMNDERFPWLILVPRKKDIQELYELEINEQSQLLTEINEISKWFKKETNAYKLNIAALGNRVPQLHIHIIARNPNDSAWPAPVWGFEKPRPYTLQKAEEMIAHLKR